jgi:hypothetical protein
MSTKIQKTAKQAEWSSDSENGNTSKDGNTSNTTTSEDKTEVGRSKTKLTKTSSRMKHPSKTSSRMKHPSKTSSRMKHPSPMTTVMGNAPLATEEVKFQKIGGQWTVGPHSTCVKTPAKWRSSMTPISRSGRHMGTTHCQRKRGHSPDSKVTRERR